MISFASPRNARNSCGERERTKERESHLYIFHEASGCGHGCVDTHVTETVLFQIGFVAAGKISAALRAPLSCNNSQSSASLLSVVPIPGDSTQPMLAFRRFQDMSCKFIRLPSLFSQHVWLLTKQAVLILHAVSKEASKASAINRIV